jgi:hypothetical protein
MKSFIQYITEDISSEKNLHISHLEELPVFEGRDGLKKVFTYINSIIKQLSGQEESNIQLKSKIDGAPALIVGINPENDQFFVGTKSVFNKFEPKINYTNEDIDKNHEDSGLNKKLKIALKYLPELGIKTIFQGDMLYTLEDLKRKNIKGQDYVIFRPNTITYAVPANSPLAKEILASKTGIVFHTEYLGSSISSLKAHFKTDLSKLKPSKNVFYRDADFDNVGQKTGVTKEKLNSLKKKEKNIKALASSIDQTFLDKMEHDQDLQTLISTYTNFLVRKGESEKSEEEKFKQLQQYTRDKIEGEMSTLKTEKGKERRKKKLDYIMNILIHNDAAIRNFFKLQNEITNFKLDIIDLFNKMQKNLHTYLDKDGTYEKTNPEGIVVVSDAGATKLIDRSEFSRANFNLPKQWDREK